MGVDFNSGEEFSFSSNSGKFGKKTRVREGLIHMFKSLRYSLPRSQNDFE